MGLTILSLLILNPRRWSTYVFICTAARTLLSFYSHRGMRVGQSQTMFLSKIKFFIIICTRSAFAKMEKFQNICDLMKQNEADVLCFRLVLRHKTKKRTITMHKAIIWRDYIRLTFCCVSRVSPRQAIMCHSYIDHFLYVVVIIA